MDEVRRWWGHFLKTSLAALGRLWEKLASGIAEDWSVSTFILVMGVVVIVAGIMMWRRRA
jgi:hypothetical protein